MHQNFIQVLLVQNEEVGKPVGDHIGRAPIPAPNSQQAGVEKGGGETWQAGVEILLKCPFPPIARAQGGPTHPRAGAHPNMSASTHGFLRPAKGSLRKRFPPWLPPPQLAQGCPSYPSFPPDLISPNTDPAFSVTSTAFPSGPPRTCTCPAWMMYISRPISP